MMYVLFYIHTDSPAYSEVLGVYQEKSLAIEKLLEYAGYRYVGGRLTQYMEPTKDYESMEILREQVSNSMELRDIDIYRIQEFPAFSS